MRVLLTGAFGNIGSSTLQELLAAGHQVRCFDLPSEKNKKTANALPASVEVVWGDLGDADAVRRAVTGCDAVIHNAAVIPPVSENNPELTKRVNIDGTATLIAACEAQPTKPKFVIASSVSLFGNTLDQKPPRRATDPVVTSDHYTRSKAACEEMLQKSSLPWVILRFSATPPVQVGSADKAAMRHYFELTPNTRVEFLHPRDAGRAQALAIASEQAVGRILLIGGGPRCRITFREMNGLFLRAIGVAEFPDSAYGATPFYLDWLDSEASDKLLGGYQRHSFEDYSREIMALNRWRRIFLWPLRGVIYNYMLKFSPYYESQVAAESSCCSGKSGSCRG